MWPTLFHMKAHKRLNRCCWSVTFACALQSHLCTATVCGRDISCSASSRTCWLSSVFLREWLDTLFYHWHTEDKKQAQKAKSMNEELRIKKKKIFRFYFVLSIFKRCFKIWLLAENKRFQTIQDLRLIKLDSAALYWRCCFHLNTCRVFHLQTSCCFVQPLQQMTESALQMWDIVLTVSDNTPETTNNINLSCDRNRSM